MKYVNNKIKNDVFSIISGIKVPLIVGLYTKPLDKKKIVIKEPKYDNKIKITKSKDWKYSEGKSGKSIFTSKKFIFKFKEKCQIYGYFLKTLDDKIVMFEKFKCKECKRESFFMAKKSKIRLTVVIPLYY